MSKMQMRAIATGKKAAVLAPFVLTAVSVHAAIPAAITDAIDTFETDAQALLTQGLGVALGITAVFVVWSLARRVFKKASSG